VERRMPIGRGGLWVTGKLAVVARGSTVGW